MYRHILRVPVHLARQPRFLKHYQFVRQLQTTSNHYKDHGNEQKGKSGSRKGFYYTLGAVVIGTSAVVAYAKLDDQFRAWLHDNVPGSDEFISFITAEDTSHVDYLARSIANLQRELQESVSKVLTFGQGDKPDDDKPKEKKPPLAPCDEDGKPYNPKKVAEKNAKLAEEEKKRKEEEEKAKKAENEPAQGVKKVEADADAPKKVEGTDTGKKPVSPDTVKKPGAKTVEDLASIEKEMAAEVEVASKAYQNAICFLKEYSEEVSKIVDESVDESDESMWQQLAEKTQMKEDNVKKSVDDAAKSETKLQQLLKSLNEPNVVGDEAEKKKSRDSAKESLRSLKAVRDEYNREKGMANMNNSYWNLVQKAREHFQEELEALFPSLSSADKKSKLADPEMDLFILYAFQTIRFYQNELSKLDTVGQAKLKAALDRSHIGDPAAVECVIEQEVEKEKRKICTDFQKKFTNLKAECEQKAKDAIKNHNMMHTEILQDALQQKEKDIMKKMKRQLDEQLVAEKEKYREEMASLLGRLKGMDELMKKRAGQEKTAVNAQLLWAACDGLVSAITCDRDCTAISMKSLAAEIEAIQSAASEDDELVSVVIASIPKVAIDRGIFGEPALKERFANTVRVARRVALLPEGGSSLPVMFISYLQSLLVISPTNPVPCNELKNEPIDPSSLNTFEVIQRAKYWMDRGDWYQVLRYMNLLKGASRVVAQDFLNEVQIFLETKQAADVLISHASATALAI